MVGKFFWRKTRAQKKHACKITKIQLRKLNSGADCCEREFERSFKETSAYNIETINSEGKQLLLTSAGLVELPRGRVPEPGRVPR